MAECRTLSHSLASCSSRSVLPRSMPARLLAVPRPVRAPLRVCAVAGLSRPAEMAGAASNLLSGHGLNAPSEEELASPVETVHSPEEFQAILDGNKDKMVVLMCKATHCRPCKMFARKFAKAAQQYSDAIFLEIFGDETKATRGLMIEMKIRVTPTFVIFRNGEKVHSHGGINETNLHRNIQKFLQPNEAGYGSFVEPEQGAEAEA